MPYDKSPMKKSSCIKMYDGKGKQAGLMMEGSAAYMSALYQTDPKDGVVVTGKDKSKSAEQARAERLAKSKQEREDALMKKKIALENRKMEAELERETKRAAIGAKRQRAEQAMKKRRGQIPSDAQDTSTNYMRGPLNQNDPKDGNETQMKDLPIGSKARYDEYNKRGWMHDETSLAQKGSRRQTDLRKSSNFKNLMDRNRVPIDEKKYSERKKKGASVSDLFQEYSLFAKGEKINLPEGTGYSRVNQRINDFRK